MNCEGLRRLVVSLAGVLRSHVYLKLGSASPEFQSDDASDYLIQVAIKRRGKMKLG